MEPGVDARRFEPRTDPVFVYLLEAAARGNVLVYAIEAPLDRFRRFDPFWAPQHSPDGARAMKAVMAQIGEGKVARPFVYPHEERLIVSDDYFLLACLEMLRASPIRAWHLGVPDSDLAAHGPIPPAQVRDLIVAPPTIVSIP